MDPYNIYSEFYDELEGQSDGSPYLDFIKTYKPDAKTILELACGTGRLLVPISNFYDVEGLDLSEPMLNQAKKKLPNVKLHHMDMSSFYIPRKFDVIYCAYDSVNHLLSFKSWLDFFEVTNKHLNKGGVFIFDMNTEHKLKTLSNSNPCILQFGENYMIMSVSALDSGVYSWDQKIFKKISDSTYKLYQPRINEVSFSMDRVNSELVKYFSNILCRDMESTISPTEHSNRVVYICTKQHC